MFSRQALKMFKQAIINCVVCEVMHCLQNVAVFSDVFFFRTNLRQVFGEVVGVTSHVTCMFNGNLLAVAWN